MYRYELSSLQGHSKVNPWCTGADLARGGHSMPPPSDKGLMIPGMSIHKVNFNRKGWIVFLEWLYLLVLLLHCI